MINQHPMRPKQKQLDIWNAEYYDGASLFDEITTRAFQWGADCQLEKVIEWLEKKRGGSMRLHSSEINSLIVDLEKAMRPQENN